MSFTTIKVDYIRRRVKIVEADESVDVLIQLRRRRMIWQAILTITLLLVFTCSDWLMDIRKKRKSKARDLAQRQAVERISGLERWSKAKEAAKRGATNFSRKLSKGVSRKRPAYDRSGELQVLLGNSQHASSRSLQIPKGLVSLQQMLVLMSFFIWCSR